MITGLTYGHYGAKYCNNGGRGFAGCVREIKFVYIRVVGAPFRFNMKAIAVLLVLVTISASLLFLSHPAYADPGQLTSNFALNYLDVRLTYPSEVTPGQSITVTLQATAKTSLQLNGLTLQIYYAILSPNSLRQVASTTIAKNTAVNAGQQLQGVTQAQIPSDAPRTSLIAMTSENATIATRYFAPANSTQRAISIRYEMDSDNAITALAYIQATTPDYLALQSQYQVMQTQMQTQINQLQKSLNQTQAQIKSMNETELQLQRTISDRDNTNTQLNDLFHQAMNRWRTFEELAAGLGILAAALAVLNIKQWRGRHRKRETTPTPS